MSAAAARLSIAHIERTLIVRFGAPERVCSWAIVGGGVRISHGVVWLEVRDEDLRPPVDARVFLRDRLAALGMGGAVGMLTSRRVDTFVDVTHTHGEASARCIATVGLGNALRAGDPPGVAGRIGTINLLCRVDVPLTDEALLEAMSIATEARTLAILEAQIPSRRSGAIATGTGTDCVVVAAPIAPLAEPYAGKHTRVGHLVGASVLDAVSRAADAWKRERA